MLDYLLIRFVVLGLFSLLSSFKQEGCRRGGKGNVGKGRGKVGIGMRVWGKMLM